VEKPTFVLQLWLRQVAKQEQVTDMVRRRLEEQQQSIEPFLVRRPLLGRAGAAVDGITDSGRVYDRGK